MSLKAKAILIFSVAIILGGGVIAYFGYQARVSRGLDIQITGPEKVLIGIPFDLRVSVVNTSDNQLQQVRLNISLPDGMAFVGSPATKNVDYRDLATLRPGDISQQTLRLIALNGQNTYKKITAEGNYLAGTLSSRFQKEADFQLAVGDYALALDIATPQKIFSGEAFETVLTYKNNSTQDLDGLRLTLEYPQGYTFARATLKPDISNNIWILGGLHKNSENKISVTGNLIGSDSASFDLKATLSASFLGQEYPINVNTATLGIASSPLSVKILLNGSQDYVANPGDALNYNIEYINTTDIGLQDVVLKVQLVGEMFDFSQLSSNGSFSSVNNTLTWNASHIPAFGSLAPGESGSVNFSIKAKSAYPIRRLSDKNFVLKARATIESPTVPNFVQASKTFSVSTLDTKVGDQVKVAAKVYFRDATSGVINKGPFPPKANQPTEFTVHWQITNYSNDIKDVTVTAFLGDNVKKTSYVKASSGGTVPSFNERTQEMTWVIPRVPATVGVISAPLEATFQIVATPSSADVGRFMTLIRESELKATDEFTGKEISAKAPAVTTQLPDDPTIVTTPGVVKQ